MNSKWQIYRVGLLDFWYYDEEEFYFLDGRMLLRGANGSGKSVTMQSFIPLLLDGNMRPERLDPFGSRARKMENYLLEEGDERQERTGYLYMELKRRESEEFLTLGIGIRARKSKKLESWYFCLTDGRRVGKDFFLYKEGQNKIACTKLELRNRIGDGGQVMDSQGEYAQCVNRLLFGFETMEEYKELLDLLIQLRTPKLSKDFKPTVINEILSSSLQTLSEDDLRPMSEAIENMDSLKTNLDTLYDSIHAAEQIEKVYNQYNEITLYDKSLLFVKAAEDYRGLQKKAESLEQEMARCREQKEQEEQRYTELKQEQKICLQERESLADSDAARLKERELGIRRELEGTKEALKEKKRQEEEKRERLLETEQKLKGQSRENELLWQSIEESLKVMEEELGEIPFDDFSFMRKELTDAKGGAYSFASHIELLRTYMQRVESGKMALEEEKACQERYSRFLQELDGYQEEKNRAQREVLQYENLLHETKQETIENIYRWEKGNKELHLSAGTLQKMARAIEQYDTETDYWSVRELANGEFEEKTQEISAALMEAGQELNGKKAEYSEALAELEQWKNQKEPEPERSEAVEENRRRLQEKGVPYLQFYKVIDFDKRLTEAQKANLEEALLHMGILDALIIPEEYREQALSMGDGVCDRYIFGDVSHVRNNIMDCLDVDNEEGDIFLYQQVSRILTAIGWKNGEGEERAEGSWVDENGNYDMGIVEGTVTGTYQPCFIGTLARERYQQQKIQELEEMCRKLEAEIRQAEEELAGIRRRKEALEAEWKAFPKEQDLKTAAKELERKQSVLEDIERKVKRQKELVETERRALDEVRLKVQEACRKCYLTPRLDVFRKAMESLAAYREELTGLQITYGKYTNGIAFSRVQENYLEEIDKDLDDIRYDFNRTAQKEREAEKSLASVLAQLALTDYEKIRERLEYCVGRLEKLPSEIEASVTRKSELKSMEGQLLEKRTETEIAAGKARETKERLERAFELEYRLGYVESRFGEDDAETMAKKLCSMLAGRFGSKKQSEILENLQGAYHQNRGYLLEYQITLHTLFEELDSETGVFDTGMRRIDIGAKYRGVPVKFKELITGMREDAQIQQRLLSDKDRELFEDILANTISKKIRGKIQASKRWVEKMNILMESMKTSSGLILSLRWKNKRADKEEQLDTRELVELLQKDAEIMRLEEVEQLSRHFRSKIEEARKASNDSGNVQSFHAVMREVLDYRQWFEFQLECQKTGEKKKELTDRVFFTFSGGEKAMAMYVPLFSAVVAKYAGARKDAPRLISLDEAFAGVDEMNIRDMFRLMVEFDFNFMINSQILWGDYDTVPGLAIYQLLRPENIKYVTVIRYVWNGKIKSMVTEKDLQHG